MYDLIVAGGGPSGSSAARAASLGGLKTLVIEKAAFPRDKPCGGALSEQGLAYLDFSLPEELIERDIFATRVVYEDRSITSRRNYRLAVIVKRSAFDSFLLDKAVEAGASTRFGEEVLSFEEGDDHVLVKTSAGEYKARYFVTAEGSQGRLYKGVRRRDTRDEFIVSMETEVPATNHAVDSYIYNAIEIHFDTEGLGYGWVFPHEERFSVGIGGMPDNFKKCRSMMQNFVKERGLGEGPLKGHTLPLGGLKRKIVSDGKRVILTGDAAGFVDAFTGEGIAYAIRSGQLAGRAVAAGDVEGTYERNCMADFGADLRHSLKLSKMMHSRPAFFFKLMMNNPVILDRLMEVPAGRGDYRDFLAWFIPRIPKFRIGAGF